MFSKKKNTTTTMATHSYNLRAKKEIDYYQMAFPNRHSTKKNELHKDLCEHDFVSTIELPTTKKNVNQLLTYYCKLYKDYNHIMDQSQKHLIVMKIMYCAYHYIRLYVVKYLQHEGITLVRLNKLQVCQIFLKKIRQACEFMRIADNTVFYNIFLQYAKDVESWMQNSPFYQFFKRLD
jgi:hydroxypyruvate isomerase